jgi:hypothetical protein
MKMSLEHSKSTTTIEQIIIPVHMPSHWGIVYVNFQDGRVYFGDGMNRSISQGMLKALKNILDVLHEIYPACTVLHSIWWKTLTSFEKLGMPSQVAKDAVVKNQGSGSCGIGVILAARDLMLHGNKVITCFHGLLQKADSIENSLCYKF